MALSKNKQGDLERFTKNGNKKKVIIASLVGLVLLVGAISLYRTFALYEEKLEFNLIQGRVPEISSGDVSIAAIVDGVKSSTIPSKNDGYEFVNAECDKDAIASWDKETWSVNISNLKTSKTICILEFKTKEHSSLSGGAAYIADLAKENSDVLVYDGTIDNNLRYIGVNPNNYVTFNNELWSIIGVMNNIEDSEGNLESHIKIIRNEGIGKYSWDNKASGTGSSTSSNGSNDWTDSALMNLLNNGAYYNRTNGTCPRGQNGASVACNFSSNGLTSVAKNMISNVVWNLGGFSTCAITASDAYVQEKSNFYSGHATEWTGEVGLMYASDYGFSVGGNVRETCIKTYLTYYDRNGCYGNNWLYKTNTSQWTITPYIINSYFITSIHKSGVIGTNTASIYNDLNQVTVFPTLYLNANVEITGGDGSSTNPFILNLPE